MAHGSHTISIYSTLVNPGVWNERRELTAYCEDCEVREDLPKTWVKVATGTLLLKYGRGYDLAPREFAAG